MTLQFKFWNALAGQDLDELHQLLLQGFDVNQLDTWDRSPLSYCVTHRPFSISMFDFLIQSKANVDIGNDNGSTALMQSIENGNQYAIDKLLENNASVHIEDNFERTALICAIERGNFKMVQQPVDRGANVNYCNSEGYTPLMIACNFSLREWYRSLKIFQGENMRNNVDEIDKIVKFLLDANADVNVKNDDNRTALLLACFTNYGKNHNIVSLLLRECADVNVIDNGKRSVLFSKDEKIVQKCLQMGAFVDVRSHNGTTPLMLAASRRKLNLVRLFCKYGANVSLQDDFGKTAADHVPCSKDEFKMTKLLLQKNVFKRRQPIMVPTVSLDRTLRLV